ncbi:hypothetical protein NP233_g7964 [Leucocoprinus birnbaumii]|uniref:Uncharacterized protein n=1 Tax=Leucocoprinus birnbaumii TaxID=56174 RepID=A0AAD5VN70_9AGAR|nr:hypothetical protein NP233_g7964 [Leucocoprinus birnbaumii]
MTSDSDNDSPMKPPTSTLSKTKFFDSPDTNITSNRAPIVTVIEKRLKEPNAMRPRLKLTRCTIRQSVPTSGVISKLENWLSKNRFVLVKMLFTHLHFSLWTLDTLLPKPALIVIQIRTYHDLLNCSVKLAFITYSHCCFVQLDDLRFGFSLYDSMGSLYCAADREKLKLTGQKLMSELLRVNMGKEDNGMVLDQSSGGDDAERNYEKSDSAPQEIEIEDNFEDRIKFPETPNASSTSKPLDDIGIYLEL